MTRAEMRDWIRRMLGIIPPVDTSDTSALPGQEPTQQPYPTNALIDQAIENAARHVNLSLGIIVDTTVRQISVAAQTADGPYRIGLDSLQTGSGSVWGVREAFWNNGSSDSPLTPASFRDLNRDGEAWTDTEAGTPTRFIVEGLSLYLYPAPSAAGTLKLRCSTGLMGPRLDSEGFVGLPDELHTELLYIALVELAVTLAGDVEMAQRARGFSDRAASGIDLIARTLNSANDRYQPGITTITYRHRRR